MCVGCSRVRRRNKKTKTKTGKNRKKIQQNKTEKKTEITSVQKAPIKNEWIKKKETTTGRKIK
jgi:hypothetical protein